MGRFSEDDQLLPPLVEPPPMVVAVASSGLSRSTHGSIETLVVVLAVIIIVGVIAGFIARLCGGRHSVGANSENDIEGWVETKCRSCIGSGLPAPPPPPTVSPAAPPPLPEELKPTNATTVEAKK